MAESGGGGGQSATIIAATIGVIGVLGAALISNWSNIFPRSPAIPAAASTPSVGNSAADASGDRANSAGATPDKHNAAQTDTTTDKPAPPLASWPNVAGTWNDGSEEWDITQSGNQVTAGDYVVTISSRGTFQFKIFTANYSFVRSAAEALRIDTNVWTLNGATLTDHMTVETRSDVSSPFVRQPQLDRTKVFTRTAS
jgi:hypothetical protein